MRLDEHQVGLQCYLVSMLIVQSPFSLQDDKHLLLAPNTSCASYPGASLNVSPAKARAMLVYISVIEHL